MIIVEGPDGSGKTTLIQALAEGTGLPIAPRVVGKDTEAMIDLVEWTETNTAQGYQNLLFDRHRLISEAIYGPILRDEPAPKFDNAAWLLAQRRALLDARPIFIFCLPPLAEVWKNVKDDPDNARVNSWEVTRQLWGAYLNTYAWVKTSTDLCFFFDYTHPLALAQQGYLIDYINRRK